MPTDAAIPRSRVEGAVCDLSLERWWVCVPYRPVLGTIGEILPSVLSKALSSPAKRRHGAKKKCLALDDWMTRFLGESYI